MQGLQGEMKYFIRQADTVGGWGGGRSLWAQKSVVGSPIFIGNYSFFITKMPFKGQIFQVISSCLFGCRKVTALRECEHLNT